MYIYDSHVHCSKDWFEPMETLLHELNTNGVAGALLIPYNGNFDNSYMLDCMKQHPDRFRVCVQVNNNAPDAIDTVYEMAAAGAVGIRLRPYDPFPDNDPFRLWHEAAKAGLSVSCHGNLDMFADPAFAALIESEPGLKIVLEHMGGAAKTVAFPNPKMELVEKLLELSRFPNVYIKLPGFGELAPRPFPFTVPAFSVVPDVVKRVYDAFGPRHIMWGSDFPPCAGREGYANVLRFPMSVPFFTAEDKEWIFGKTADSVWATR